MSIVSCTNLYLLLSSETVHDSDGCCPQNRNMRLLSLLRVYTSYDSFRNAWWYEQVALLLSNLARRNHFYYLALGSRPFEHWTLELVHGTVTTCCLRRKPENTYPRKNCSGTGTARVIFEGWNSSRPVSQLLACHRCTSACKCLDTFPSPMKWPQFKGVEKIRQAWQELRSRILTGTYE